MVLVVVCRLDLHQRLLVTEGNAIVVEERNYVWQVFSAVDVEILGQFYIYIEADRSLPTPTHQLLLTPPISFSSYRVVFKSLHLTLLTLVLSFFEYTRSPTLRQAACRPEDPTTVLEASGHDKANLTNMYILFVAVLRIVAHSHAHTTEVTPNSA